MWGQESWGSMLWGAGVPPVPSIGLIGVGILVAGLAATGYVLSNRWGQRGFAISAAATLVVGGALAAAAVPNTFLNGTIADADEVNANFAAIDAQFAAVCSCVPVGGCGCQAPIVLINPPSSPSVGILAISFVSVVDPDSDPGGCALIQGIIVNTQFVDMPPGSAAVLTPSVGSSPSFVPDVAGQYAIRSTATDDAGVTGYDEVIIVVAP